MVDEFMLREGVYEHIKQLSPPKYWLSNSFQNHYFCNDFWEEGARCSWKSISFFPPRYIAGWQLFPRVCLQFRVANAMWAEVFCLSHTQVCSMKPPNPNSLHSFPSCLQYVYDRTTLPAKCWGWQSLCHSAAPYRLAEPSKICPTPRLDGSVG